MRQPIAKKHGRSILLPQAQERLVVVPDELPHIKTIAAPILFPESGDPLFVPGSRSAVWLALQAEALDDRLPQIIQLHCTSDEDEEVELAVRLQRNETFKGF